MPRLRSMLVDTSALRESRDYRVLVGGGFVSGLGSQLTMVALPYQVFLLTRSSLLVGLLGLVEFVPLASFALIGGALADRIDRRRLLLWSQLLMLSTSAALAVGAPPGSPPVACSTCWRRWPPAARHRPADRAAIIPGWSAAAGCARRSRSTTACSS